MTINKHHSRLLSLLSILAVGAMLLVGAPPVLAGEGGEALAPDSLQLVLVTVRDWNASTGQLRRYERPDAAQPWTQVGETVPVLLGRNGLGWGRGLSFPGHEAGAVPVSGGEMGDVSSDVSGGEMGHGPVKREGDGRAPAGLFALGPAFAYSPGELGPVGMPVLAVTESMACVDDPESQWYTAMVDQDKVGEPDWKSRELMLREDGQYKIGLVVRHNGPEPKPGAGSCIFLHVWKDGDDSTSGCTALREADLRELLGWIKGQAKPVLLQLPEDEAAKFQPMF